MLQRLFAAPKQWRLLSWSTSREHRAPKTGNRPEWMNWRRWVMQFLLPVAGTGLALVGVLLLGQWAWQDLQGQDRYQIPFAEIECVPPAGMTKKDFLDEVQYLEEVPDQLPLLDPELPTHLASIFVAHPWVERVRHVEVLPPRRVRVVLDYRTPVLAVALNQDGQEQPTRTRAVDSQGVLLPRAANQVSLPVLFGRVGIPEGGPGHPWGDPQVKSAANTIAFLQAQELPLALSRFRVQILAGDILLHNSRTRILWGQPPGQEKGNEPTAETKLQRLRHWLTQSGNGLGLIDLRTAS